MSSSVTNKAHAENPDLAMIALLQQIHTTLNESLQQQNTRLERLEKLVIKDGQAQDQTISADDVPLAAKEQDVRPASSSPVAPIKSAPFSKPIAPSNEPSVEEGSAQSADSVPRPYTITAGPHNLKPGRLRGEHSTEAKNERDDTSTGNVEEQSSFPASTSFEGIITSYLDPCPIPTGPSFFENNPEVEMWLRKNMWLPCDHRVPLCFDVDGLNCASSLSSMKEIGNQLHRFNAEIISQLGRFVIIDDFGYGRYQIFGNEFFARREGRRPRRIANVRKSQPFYGALFKDQLDLNSTLELPVMQWGYGYPPIAPWRRAIIIEGVGEVISKDVKDHRAIVEGFFSDEFSGAGNPLEIFLNSRQSRYVERVDEPAHFSNKYTVQIARHLLHYSWFTLYSADEVRQKPVNEKIGSYADTRHACSLAGRLYGDKELRWIGRRNTTIELHYSTQPVSNVSGLGPLLRDFQIPEHYTVILVRPPTVIDMTISDVPSLSAQVVMIHQSAIVLESIFIDAREIADYLENMLDIGDNVLYDPNEHDRLLFDDDTFSSSRKYWWAMDMLSTIRQSIEQCLLAHNEMYNDLIWPAKRMNPLPPGLENADRRAGVAYTNLQELLKRFVTQQTRVDALRSGLFNASGVVESRASTRLGEIVKLLTYVSIFYLPLSFSTSLWQTTPFFSEQNTAILFTVMIVVGVVTYSTTFNLNNIVRLWNRRYEEIKDPIIKQMSEEGGIWQHRASLFSGFRPRRENSSPSEWWVLWYVIIYPFMPSHARKLFSRRNEQNENHAGTDSWASKGHRPHQRRDLQSDESSNDTEWMRGMPGVDANATETATRSTNVQRTSYDNLQSEQIRRHSASQGNSEVVGGDKRVSIPSGASFVPAEHIPKATQPRNPKAWVRQISSSTESRRPGRVNESESAREKDPAEQV